VPERWWKVMLILAVGDNDLQRVTSDTRVIAVDMPNTQ
jgi:endonuclease G